MLYFHDCKIKMWNEPYQCEQMIFNKTTVLARQTTRENFLPKCKRMVFNNSIVNKLDFLFKPYAKRVLEHFEVRFSFVSRT